MTPPRNHKGQPQTPLRSVEPTIWALRKNVRGSEQNNVPSLYEHLYGYEPILVATKAPEEKIRNGSAENPALNIINPQTNFTLMEIAADLPPENN